MRSIGKDGMKIKRAEGDVEGRQIRPKPQPPTPKPFLLPLCLSSPGKQQITLHQQSSNYNVQTHSLQPLLHTDSLALATVARKSTGGAGKQGTWVWVIDISY